MEVREDCFTVKTYHCGTGGKITTASLMRFMQESASSNADELGFGFTTLEEADSYWVLSNLRMEFGDLPGWSEQVKIRTWPSSRTRTTVRREFVGVDGSGSEFLRACSEWMVIKKSTNRLRNLCKMGLPLEGIKEEALSKSIKRLKARDDYEYAETIRVPYSAIDFHDHVNNTEYVRWGTDALRRKYGFDGFLKAMQITYLREVFEGDELDLSVCVEGEGAYGLMGKRHSDDEMVYLMEIVC